MVDDDLPGIGILERIVVPGRQDVVALDCAVVPNDKLQVAR